MSTTLRAPADLFTALDSALIMAEFARITDDQDMLDVAEREANTLSMSATDAGYILAATDCDVDDVVQNSHGDTGTVVSAFAGPASARVSVRWDAPSPYPTTFGAAALFAGHLRHTH